MTAPEAAAALEDARLQQHIDRDREDLADDERGPAEVAEWERIAQLLATTGGTYDPKADAVVQDELAAEAAAAAKAEEELRDLEMEQQRQEWLHSNGLPERAHMLMALEKAGLLGRTEGRYGAEGPLVLHEPEDRHVLDYLNEYGEFYDMFRIPEGHGMAPLRGTWTPFAADHGAGRDAGGLRRGSRGAPGAGRPGRRARARRLDRGPRPEQPVSADDHVIATWVTSTGCGTGPRVIRGGWGACPRVRAARPPPGR
jgi:hypothetical protein